MCSFLGEKCDFLGFPLPGQRGLLASRHTHACTSFSYRLPFYRMSSGNVALVLDHITDYIY